MKLRCSMCNRELPSDDFGRRRNLKRGFAYNCKSCLREDGRRRRTDPATRPGILAAKRKYNNKKSVRQRRADKLRSDEYKRKDAEKVRNNRRRWPEKARARWAISNALARGKTSRPLYCAADSSDCDGRIEAHHWDYARPLDVVWLCDRHHKWIHMEKA